MIENLLGIDSDFIIIGMLAVLIIFLILIIVIMTRLGRLKNKYEQFMRGKDGKSLEENLIFRLDQIDELIEANAANERNIDAIFRKMKFNFQKYSLVKYDAFNEMGGKLSFALCMLDKLNNGYLVNVMHSNNGCFAYVKEIVDGQSYIELGEEEQKALDEAVAGRTGDAILGKKVNEMLENSGKNK